MSSGLSTLEYITHGHKQQGPTGPPPVKRSSSKTELPQVPTRPASPSSRGRGCGEAHAHPRGRGPLATALCSCVGTVPWVCVRVTVCLHVRGSLCGPEHAHVPMHTRVCGCTCVYACECEPGPACTYVSVRVPVGAHVCMWTCACVCVCEWAHRRGTCMCLHVSVHVSRCARVHA